MKSFTMVRNGIVRQLPWGTHKCGSPETNEYPYRVELTVVGELRAPTYWIVDNQEIDDVVQATFWGKPTVSCERMCDLICQKILEYMKTRYNEWKVKKLHTELTGTNGKALLSCDWEAS